MLRDALMTIIDDGAFTGDEATGVVDLYGVDIPDAHARGKGSTMAIQVVIKTDKLNTPFGGTATITIKSDDTDGTVTTIQTNVINGADIDHTGVVGTMFLPEQPPGRYLGVTVNRASLTGGDAANDTVDAWIFAL